MLEKSKFIKKIKNLLIIIAILSTIQIWPIKHFVLISAPGSGKGAFSQYLIQKYGYVQVCPGDIFRNEIRTQSRLGKKIAPIVEKGEYVEENIVCQLIAEQLIQIIKQNKPFIIDGFPRSEISFNFLNKFFQDNNLTKNICYLQLIASDNTCINRVEKRQNCMQCFRVYNSLSAKPKEKNKCDNCSIELEARKSDTKNIIKCRLEFFHTHVEPLIAFAENLYETKKIETECSLQELYKHYDELIETIS